MGKNRDDSSRGECSESTVVNQTFHSNPCSIVVYPVLTFRLSTYLHCEE